MYVLWQWINQLKTIKRFLLTQLTTAWIKITISVIHSKSEKLMYKNRHLIPCGKTHRCMRSTSLEARPRGHYITTQWREPHSRCTAHIAES